MIRTNQNGYILTECLVGLIILTTVCMTLITSLPILLKAEQHLEIEQQIYYKLYELHDQANFYDSPLLFPQTFHSPVTYTITTNNKKLCATYTRGESRAKTICL